MYEEEARVILAGERAAVLVGIVENAWADYLAERKIRRRRTGANIVSDNMLDLAMERLAPLDGVLPTDYQGTPWSFLTTEWRSASRSTTGSFGSRTSAPAAATPHKSGVDLPGLAALSFSCGYQLDRAQADIDRIVVTKAIGVSRTPEWSSTCASLRKVEARQPRQPSARWSRSTRQGRSDSLTSASRLRKTKGVLSSRGLQHAHVDLGEGSAGSDAGGACAHPGRFPEPHL